MRSLALLRGVNVGGRHKLAMKDLVNWLESAGVADVTTYIQSGNVAFDHDRGLDVADLVRRVITHHTGWDISVVVRSAREMRDVFDKNPYPGIDPTTLHVAFLDVAPEVTDDDSQRWLPEEYHVEGREVYLHLPEGMGRSVMAPRLALVRTATTRNWNTVVALAEMLDTSRR